MRYESESEKCRWGVQQEPEEEEESKEEELPTCQGNRQMLRRDPAPREIKIDITIPENKSSDQSSLNDCGLDSSLWTVAESLS